jgi:type IV pilus assembly protein PilA
MIPEALPQPRKALAVWSLVLGILSLLTGGCLGIGAIVAIVLGIVALSKAGKLPAEYGGKGMAIGGIVTGSVSLVLLPFVIIAAIAIPSLLRARLSANESAAIGDIRVLISGQGSYSGSNGGYYDTLECLASANTCIPDYGGYAPLMDQRLLAGVKSGYRRTFYPGPPAPRDSKISPSSITSYAFTAVPVTLGRTGIRGFCGDDTGRIYYTMDGTEPPMADGRCAESFNLIQ